MKTIDRGMLESHGLTPDAADYVMRQFEEVRDELERVEKQAAAMREALVKCKELLNHTNRLQLPSYTAMQNVMEAIKAALSSDPGANCIHKDQVRPLVEALNEAAQCRFFYMESMDMDDDAKERVMQALAHARTLGL